MSGTMTLDPPARELAERELDVVTETRAGAPDLDRLRKLMPRANGDQDVW